MNKYPTSEEHAQRWEELAEEIDESKHHLREQHEEGKKGSLLVLGSGIQGVSFPMGSEPFIRMADKVFYTVSNPPTQVWLHTLRPDAFDLYVLYDDSKPRYYTYVQMSEAILHYVRKGLKVVTVFYGHPGIFVFSTHRSIEIARREGHYAVMMPGISALDCLCADLGVDPAFPGMQTFEATDLLVRKRSIDIGTHLVLWQVGLIGDTGYRRKGFINDKFPILVEYLMNYYGPDHELTHYIAARHPTFEPTMAVHKMKELLEPRVRATFTAISTFYVAPMIATPTDADMAVRLGLVKPRQQVADAPAQRKMALYGTREVAAVSQFGDFSVPKEYQFQMKTRASEFLTALGQDPVLQSIYRETPGKAVSDEVFPGLSPTEKYLLATRNENLAQVAAKGTLVPHSPNEKLVIDLHKTADLAASFRAQLVEWLRNDDGAAVDSWITSNGYEAELSRLPDANKKVNASMLLPWTGVYTTADSSLVLTVIGSPNYNSASVVYANQLPISKFAFSNGILTWLASEGNPHSAELIFQMPSIDDDANFVRSLSGTYWAADAEEPTEPNIEAHEVALTYSPASVWAGRYTTRVTDDGADWKEGPEIEVVTPKPGETPIGSYLKVDGKRVDPVEFSNGIFRWGDNQISFSQSKSGPGGNILTGSLSGYWSEGANLDGASVADDNSPFRGKYRTYLWTDSQWSPCGEFVYDSGKVLFGKHTIEESRYASSIVQWEAEEGQGGNGFLKFFIDPAAQLPKFVGSLWNSSDKPEHPNFLGVYELPEGVSSGSLAPTGDIGVPQNVWETLGKIGTEGLNPGCHFLWSRWQRSRFTSRVLNRFLLKLCE